eukprot:jgi/Ulvmu1/5436/UM221_0001.1
MMLPFKEAKKAYRENGVAVDWYVSFRRQQALIDPRWLCFLPEQFMTLGRSTCDLHQTAEMLVSRSKGDLEEWVRSKDPCSPEVTATKNYNERLHTACAVRNDDTPKPFSSDKDAIKASVAKTWVDCTDSRSS